MTTHKTITKTMRKFYPNMCAYIEKNNPKELPNAQVVPREFLGPKIDLFYKYLLNNNLKWEDVLNDAGDHL